MKIVAYHLGIELTQRCNLNCSHCFRGESHIVNITRDILEKVFDEIVHVDTLDLSGGEVFLAYDQLKLLLEVAKEKETKINYCSLLINGTIYDERIYSLLDEYFGDNYQVAISNDDFHDKSIGRIYNNKEKSNNPFLFPKNLDEVKVNMSLNFNHSSCTGFQRISKRLSDNGRATGMDTPKKEFEAIGYYYSFLKEELMLAGPMIFIGADGYISDINSDIEKRNTQSIGNVLNEKLSDCILKGGILSNYDEDDIFSVFEERENDFFAHKGEHLIFKDNKMASDEYTVYLKYQEALNNVEKDFWSFYEALVEGKEEEFFQNWDPIYNGDLSQIEHTYVPIKKLNKTNKGEQ